MNGKANGDRIEELIIKQYRFTPDKIGFDALKGKQPVEIKGCLMHHKNGVDLKRAERITAGRYWIDNRAHRLLLKEDGIYVFVLYEMVNEEVVILKSKMYYASSVDRFIGKGDNTKLSYKFIFPELDHGDDS